jgi:hypothetical protein
VHLLGAFSNSETGERLEKLVKLRKRLLQNCSESPQSSTALPPRTGETSEAILKVLSIASDPMRTTVIHRAVEQQLGRPVKYRSVKAWLSKETLKTRPRVERIAYGEYQSLLTQMPDRVMQGKATRTTASPT